MQVAHWSYGGVLGGVYGLVQGTIRAPTVAHGSAFGVLVWLASHGVLVPGAKLEPPLPKQPPGELAFGLASHVAYGVATAAAYDALEGRL